MERLVVATGDAIALVRDGQVDLALERTGTRCVARDPRDSELLLAGGAQGVWLSENGGATWRDLDLPAPDVFSVAIAADGRLYAGTEPSMLFVSADRGASWDELAALRALPSQPTWSFPPRPWTSHVRWIAPSPHDPSLLLVGIELGGLMRSSDGGESWQDHRPGAQRDVHSLAWHPSVAGRAYEAGGGGAAWSEDGGDTWAPADEGRDRHYVWSVTADPEDETTWFVSASTGPFAAHRLGRADARIFRRRGDQPWQPLTEPLAAMPYALAFAGRTLVAGLADGRLLASSDGGDGWRELDARVPAVSALVVS